MNILFLNHYAGSRNRGMEYRTYYLVREWARNGHNVTVCAASYTHLRPKIEPSEDYREDGVRYIWIPTPEYKSNLERGINALAYTYRCLRKAKPLGRSLRPDIIVASSPHPFVVYVGHRMAKQCRVPWIYEVRDLWPSTLVELLGMNKLHPFAISCQIAEDFGYKHCSAAISLLPSASEYMVSRGLSPDKFHWIPTGISVADWNGLKSTLPQLHQEVLSRLRQENRFLVAYVGHLGVSQPLEDFLKAASMLSADEKIAFVVVGKGPEGDRFKKLAEQLQVKNVYFLPEVPKASVPAVLSQMDVLYLGFKRCDLYKHGISPNKLYEYMMSGKPIIHGVETPLDLVKETQCGLSIAPEDPDEIVKAVLTLQSMSPEMRQEMGNRGPSYVTTHYDYRILAQRMEELMGSLIQKNSVTEPRQVLV